MSPLFAMRTSRILPWKPSNTLLASPSSFGEADMPARTGQQYIDGLRAQEREIWLGGERVRDVTKHKGLAGGVRAIAHLYDMQHDLKLREVMTFASPTSGGSGGR